MNEQEEKPEEPKPKSLVKTMTFGLGNPMGFDHHQNTLTELNDVDRKRTYTAIMRGFRDFARICNITTSLTYIKRVLKADLKKIGFNKGYAPIREQLELEDTPLSGYVLNQNYNVCGAHFAGEHGKALMREGRTALPVHRADGTHPLYFHRLAVSLRQVEKHFYIALNIFNGAWAEKNKLPTWIAFPLKIKPRDKTSQSQLERILAGEWKSKNGRLMRNKRDVGPKYLVQLSVSYTPEPFKPLSDSVVLGIDLGVNAPATVHVREGVRGKAWAPAVGDGRGMLAARNVIRGEIKRLIRALRAKDSPLTGKTRDNALERLRDLRRRERRVMKTASQRIAARIADIARRSGAGIWQIEDLGKGISLKEDKPWLARNWAPGAVIDALRWQAKQLGIAPPVQVDPAYTSQRCSDCGHISSANRPKGKQGAAYFKCVSCGHEENADKNAARNLSIRDIDKIIKETHVPDD